MSAYVHPKSALAEAFRTLRTSLNYTADRTNTRVILVTSPGVGDGKTTVSCNLAMSMAQAGEKVLLIDADLRKPRCHRYFSLPNRMGLTNALVDGTDATSMMQETSTPGLFVLTSGPIPPNPAELLESSSMDAVLQLARKNFDHIIVDAPPAGPLADTYILASKVDGIILVLVSGETRIDIAREVKDSLEKAKGKILGVVLNKVRYSSRDYRYKYYYYYGDERGRRKSRDEE